MQRGQRIAQRAAHAVVVDDVLGILGQRHSGTRDRVAPVVVLHHDGLLARHLDGVVLQGAQERHGGVVGRGKGGLHRSNARIRIAHSHGPRRIQRKRVRLPRRAQQQAGSQALKSFK